MKSFSALTIVLLWINFSVTLCKDGISDGMMLTPSFKLVYHFIQTLLGWMEGCCILRDQVPSVWVIYQTFGFSTGL